MTWRFLFAAALTLTVIRAETNAELVSQVRQAEVAFAKTLADRNQKAFTTFLAREAVFMNGTEAMRGSVAVAAGWKSVFEGKTA